MRLNELKFILVDFGRNDEKHYIFPYYTYPNNDYLEIFEIVFAICIVKSLNIEEILKTKEEIINFDSSLNIGNFIDFVDKEKLNREMERYGFFSFDFNLIIDGDWRTELTKDFELEPFSKDLTELEKIINEILKNFKEKIKT